MIPDQEIVSCAYAKCQRFWYLSLFSTQLVSHPCGTALSPNLQHVTNKYLFKRNVKAIHWMCEKLLAVTKTG